MPLPPRENRGPQMLGAVVAMTAVATVTVVLRFFVRLRIVHSFGIDDYVILLSTLISLAGLGLEVAEVHYGGGQHAVYLDKDVLRTGLKLNLVTQPVYVWAIASVKISICFFLLRIAPGKFYRYTLWGIIIYLVTYTTAAMLTIVLQCIPTAMIWDVDHVLKGKCFTVSVLRGLSYYNATSNIITDLYLATLPIPMLWHVQINKRTKIAITGILSLGYFACACTIVRTSYIVNYGKTGDFLWDSVNLTIWTCAECNTGITAASIPHLKPLFQAILQKTYYSNESRTGRKGYEATDDSGNGSHSLGTMPSSNGGKNQSIISHHHHGRKGPMGKFSANRDSASDSEESILPLQGRGITKTTEVTVGYGRPGDPEAGYGRGL